MQDTETPIDKTQFLPDGVPVRTPERKRNRTVVVTEGERGGRQYVSLAEPLEFYVAKRVITGKQYRAGKRLHGLWERGAKSPYVQVQYRLDDGGAKAQSFVPAGFMATAYRDALYAVKNERARRIVFLVCCTGVFAGKTFPETVSARTAKRNGISLLREALDVLADHFKYD